MIENRSSMCASFLALATARPVLSFVPNPRYSLAAFAVLFSWAPVPGFIVYYARNQDEFLRRSLNLLLSSSLHFRLLSQWVEQPMVHSCLQITTTVSRAFITSELCSIILIACYLGTFCGLQHLAPVQDSVSSFCPSLPWL